MTAEQSQSKRIFLTGSTGFIGRHVARAAVDAGFTCVCLVRPTTDTSVLPAENIHLVQGDLLQPASYQQQLLDCDFVIHLAGITQSLDIDQLYETNERACELLCDVCKSSDKLKRLVYLSSLAAAGPPSVGKASRVESDPIDPVSEYGRSKRAGELAFIKEADSVATTIMRPGIVLGPGDRKQAELIQLIYRWRLHIVAGFRTPDLSMIHVDDLTRLIFSALLHGETLTADPASGAGVYFAVDDSEFPNYWQFGKQIASALDQSVFVWPLWRWVARTVAYVNQSIAASRHRTTTLTVDKIREATVRSWASSASKAREQLGFAPEIPLSKRIEETAQWYVSEDWV